MIDLSSVIISTLLGVMLGSVGTLFIIQPQLENLKRANARLLRNKRND